MPPCCRRGPSAIQLIISEKKSRRLAEALQKLAGCENRRLLFAGIAPAKSLGPTPCWLATLPIRWALR